MSRRGKVWLAVGVLAAFAACPAQAQTAQPKPLAVAAVVESMAVATEAVAEAHEAAAAAWEASILTRIAWAAIGEIDEDTADILGARNNASEARNNASEARNNASEARELATQFREEASEVRRSASAAWAVASAARELATQFREGVSEVRNKAWEARGLASEAEGNMMKAQANATGRYAALWERAAAAGVERTAWVRVASRRDAMARALDAVAEAWEAVERDAAVQDRERREALERLREKAE